MWTSPSPLAACSLTCHLDVAVTICKWNLLAQEPAEHPELGPDFIPGAVLALQGMGVFLKNWGTEDVSYCDQFWNISGVEAARRRFCLLDFKSPPTTKASLEQNSPVSLLTITRPLVGEADI